MSWLVVKHKETGELSIVNRVTRERQIQLWVLNGLVVPSIVMRSYRNIEEAADFLTEIYTISEMINNILEKDE